MPTLPSLFISVMRTGVPLVAGWLLTLAVKAGVSIDSGSVTYAVTVALVLVYYGAFRLLELLGTRLRGSGLQKFAGFLLGWARPPQYPHADGDLPPLTGASAGRPSGS
ncbi:hypothetical protein PYK79_31730 [Streptomyces sp. ID05-04B]|uniref:hypothetical protein n=1 Tax=Streptomyces sp. ID05-04B TaxID=3028661 RepID=UPI0029C1A90A|nr:hypothetical protein [Streptomyces sp. ID05-04B]MDX5566904.1 hypothetical protein [Streptomyces sp. ID05-04B]